MSDAANCMHRQFTESQSYCPDCGLSRSEVLVAACEPYLKDDETPAECIARNRRDVDGCLTMLVAEKRKTEALQPRLAEAEALLREGCGYIDDVPDRRSAYKDRVRAFLAPDSASGAWDRECVKCACKWVEAKAGPNCPRCGGEDFYGLPKGNTAPDQPEDAGK